MLMLVATKKTQGDRSNDFSWTDEGELVGFLSGCDSDHSPDDHCGCYRAMTGMITRKCTTTVEVAEVDKTKEELIALYAQSCERAGFQSNPKETIAEVEELNRIAEQYGIGMVLEFRDGVFKNR